MNQSVLLHLTVGVPDLDLAEHFYVEAFGFARAPQRFRGDGQAIAEISGFGARGESSAHAGIFLRRGSFFMELVNFASAEVGPETLHLKHYGYQHMCFGVTDMEKTLTLVEQCGGRVDRSRRLDIPISESVSGAIVYCHDCAGNTLELIEHRDSDAAAAHATLFGLKELGWGKEAPGRL
jgi:catechol 2,3-dioxygenase-like lactoylglutathione lyase family enzyme